MLEDVRTGLHEWEGGLTEEVITQLVELLSRPVAIWI